MARIRTIKPEFFTSEDILDLSVHARLLYVGLWCEADREGRLSWKPKTLKVRYLPSDDVDIESLGRELTAKGLIRLYGEGFAYIPSFLKHQHVNPREAKSILPDPPDYAEADLPARVGHASNLDLHASSRVNDASNLDLHAQVGREGKGKERKGKEGEGRESENIPSPQVEIQKQKPEPQDALPDRLIAGQDAKRIAEKYRRMIAPTSTPRNGEEEIFNLIVDQRIPAEDLERAVKHLAEWRAAIPKPPFPCHAKSFFGTSKWESFRDEVPEQIKPPDPEAEEKAAREARDAEWRRKGDIAAAREIEALNAAAAANRKAKAQLTGG